MAHGEISCDREGDWTVLKLITEGRVVALARLSDQQALALAADLNRCAVPVIQEEP